MPPSDTPTWRELTPAALREALAAPNPPVVVDVRTRPEVEAYHLPGVRWIPLQELGLRVRELDPSRETVLLCEHGIRSVAACQFLSAQGFARLANLTGGMSVWDGPTAMGTPL